LFITIIHAFITRASSVKLRLHIAIGMQTRLQTDVQAGVSGVYTERLVCKPVCQPIVVTFTYRATGLLTGMHTGLQTQPSKHRYTVDIYLRYHISSTYGIFDIFDNVMMFSNRG